MSTPTPSTPAQTCPRPREETGKPCGAPAWQGGPKRSPWAGKPLCVTCYGRERRLLEGRRQRYLPTEPLETMTALVPVSLAGALRSEAARQGGRPLAELVRDALSDYLEQVGALSSLPAPSSTPIGHES